MSPTEPLTKAFVLSLLAGILILSNSALLGVVAMWFPGILPTLPGSSTNDPAVLYRLTAVGLLCGVLVLFGAVLLRVKPANKKAWGIVILVFSIPSVITGGGFIIGFIAGTIGATLALSRKSTKQAP